MQLHVTSASSPPDELPSIREALAPVLARLSPEQHPLLVALAERIAADRYRVWADAANTSHVLACVRAPSGRSTLRPGSRLSTRTRQRRSAGYVPPFPSSTRSIARSSLGGRSRSSSSSRRAASGSVPLPGVRSRPARRTCASCRPPRVRPPGRRERARARNDPRAGVRSGSSRAYEVRKPPAARARA